MEIEYKILSNKNMELSEYFAEISKHLNQKWSLNGDLVIDKDGFYHQVLVRNNQTHLPLME